MFEIGSLYKNNSDESLVILEGIAFNASNIKKHQYMSVYRLVDNGKLYVMEVTEFDAEFTQITTNETDTCMYLLTKK